MRRTHRSHRFAVKMAVVAVVAALAAAVDLTTTTTTRAQGSITSGTVGDSHHHYRDGAGAEARVHQPMMAASSSGLSALSASASSQRALLNERGHLASAALHGGRAGAQGAAAAGGGESPLDDPCSGTTINAQPNRCAYVTAKCPNDEGESLMDYRQFHYCTMDGWPGASVAALVGVVVLAFYVLG